MPNRVARITVGGTPRVVDLARTDTGTLILGNFRSYAPGGQWSAYTGMWGHYLPENANLQAESSLRVFPASFPNNTVISWDVTPDPHWGGVNGYLAISYGNYDGSPSTITPRQVKNIAELTVNTTWTYTGNASTGLLCEMWLASVAAPSGGFAKTHEIAFFPKFSAGSRSWLDSLPQVGTGFTAKGVSWKVRIAGNPQGVPYIIAYRADYADIQGAMPFKDFFIYLQNQGQITGNEWFNGVAFGPEPTSGVASLTINTMSVIYTASTPVVTGPALAPSPTLVTSP